MCPLGTAEIKILRFSLLVYAFTTLETYKYRTFSVLKFRNWTDPAKLVLSLLLLQPTEIYAL